MYSLDINFIKDRPEYKSAKVTQRISRPSAAGNSSILYLGLAVGLLLPTLAGAGWFFLQSQNTKIEQEIAKIDADLNRLGIKEEEIKKIQEQTTQIQADTQALATVFNQLRPWSAILQDVRDRIPKAAQIDNIKQITAVPPPAGQPAAVPAAPAGQPAPIPVSGVEISGFARSFNDVNDFLLSLQQSAFFKPTDTKIITAELIDNPIAVTTVSQLPGAEPPKLPQVVRYTIQSSLSDAQASELLRELERKGAVGLPARIRTLQQKGVIQQ